MGTITSSEAGQLQNASPSATSLDIEEALEKEMNELVISTQKSVESSQAGPSRPFTMCKVPECVKKVNPEDFAPEKFHIGIRNWKHPTSNESNEGRKKDLVANYIQVKGLSWSVYKSAITAEWDKMQVGHEEVSTPSSEHVPETNSGVSTGGSMSDSAEASSSEGPESMNPEDGGIVKNILTMDTLAVVAICKILEEDSRLQSSKKGVPKLDLRPPTIKDLFLVENQIPLKLIKSVYEAEKNRGLNVSFDNMLEMLITSLLPFPFLARRGIFRRLLNIVGLLRKDVIVERNLSAWYKQHRNRMLLDTPHLLDCMYKVICYQPTPPTGTSDSSSKCPKSFHSLKTLVGTFLCYCQNFSRSTLDTASRRQTNTSEKYRLPRLPSATRLLESGIEVTPYAGRLGDIKFEPRNSIMKWLRKAKLIVPMICINDRTVVLLRNLAVYEQEGTDSCTLTMYLQMMSALVESAEDVNLLSKDGVIRNSYGKNEEVAKVFSRIVSGLDELAPAEPFGQIYNAVFERYHTLHPSAWWQFQHDNKFDNPCVFWGVFLFLMLAVCAVVQTYFNVVRAVNEGDIWFH